MRPTLLPLLRCTYGCENDLSVEIFERKSGEVFFGNLHCKECGRTYPIEEGIPRMLPDGLLSDLSPAGGQSDKSLQKKKREMRARDSQVEEYDQLKYLNLFGKVEIPLTLYMLSPGRGDLVLEAGCGTVRMTPIFAGRCGRLISIDFSMASLKACAAKLQEAGIKNVDLIQADICHLPLRTKTFPRVVSCQVLEHIPTRESREEAVHELARVLEPGGRLILSAYQFTLLHRLFVRKEGEHPGGIPFYRFSRKELHRLLAKALKVEKITGAMVYHYTAKCSKAGAAPIPVEDFEETASRSDKSHILSLSDFEQPKL